MATLHLALCGKRKGRHPLRAVLSLPPGEATGLPLLSRALPPGTGSWDPSSSLKCKSASPGRSSFWLSSRTSSGQCGQRVWFGGLTTPGARRLLARGLEPSEATLTLRAGNLQNSSDFEALREDPFLSADPQAGLLQLQGSLRDACALDRDRGDSLSV